MIFFKQLGKGNKLFKCQNSEPLKLDDKSYYIKIKTFGIAQKTKSQMTNNSFEE